MYMQLAFCEWENFGARQSSQPLFHSASVLCKRVCPVPGHIFAAARALKFNSSQIYYDGRGAGNRKAAVFVWNCRCSAASHLNMAIVIHGPPFDGDLAK